MHEVKGSDGVGATMDSMDLERAKGTNSSTRHLPLSHSHEVTYRPLALLSLVYVGITIKSAATHASWRDHHINVIDTPGHVDFTIEVERSLRVLDGAVFVLCGVAGVQSQSITVDKQMKRYNVPRVLFINKLDRQGANPWKAIRDCRTILQHTCAAVQITMGLESQMEGIIDLVAMEAIYYEGPRGDNIRKGPIPDTYKPEVEAKRKELIEVLAEVDETFMDAVLSDQEITKELLMATIRRATIDLKFIPVFMGTALKNKGVQTMLDGVIDYLPNPYEVKNYALDLTKNEKKIRLVPDSNKPLVALAFKLEEGQYGQLTYMRIYQGTLKRGESIMDVSTGQKVRVPRLCRMHSAAMEPLNEIGAGT
jgi:elongation factor G